MSGSDPKRDLSKLTPALRQALVDELVALTGRAGLHLDEEALLRHILAYAGLSEVGLYLPVLASLWSGAPSYVPPAALPPDRALEAARFLRRRGILRDAEGGAAFVDAAALRELVDKTSKD